MKARAELGKEEGDQEKRRGQTTESSGDWERRKSQGSRDGDNSPLGGREDRQHCWGNRGVGGSEVSRVTSLKGRLGLRGAQKGRKRN